MDAPRTLYREDHELFRTTVRRFLERDYLPRQRHCPGTEALDRELWLQAGRQGLLCVTLPAQYGGGGDFGHAAVITEEFASIGVQDRALSLHSDIVAPCLASLGTLEQKQRWLPGVCSGAVILALAMAEAQGDEGECRTYASRDGDDFLINGSTCAVGNGGDYDLLLLACLTEDADGDLGLSLIMVESDRPGICPAHLAKAIRPGAGVCREGLEINLTDVRVPQTHLLGEAGRGEDYLHEALQQQQLLTAIFAARQLEQLLDPVLAQDSGPGGPPWDPQDIRLTLASIKARALSLGHGNN
ncbi:acyl-CoA dehydrogenase [Pseudomonas alkylphenolica]|jgi:alkylation response protein AidB-like acyl-CoA dehydrogenase|uniref:Acyl-CoA dehydrogenase n=1 Tax=Pseudomonas alkylphenolica TaxID=237609 RepID=A0A6I6GSS0_9PSED|nr:acyl-CoA dehydrogenase family protein [Pseudomonas alkylphenolica]QGW77532.1 acyl-CoA dehydrogenase [Pseudomonas alkylphenolica]